MQSYVTFLNKSGIAKVRIRVLLWPNPDKSVTKQCRYWARLLSLPLKQIHLETKSNNKPPKAPYGNPTIIVTTSQAPEKIKRIQVRGKTNPPSGPAVGLKFALFMAAVVLMREKERFFLRCLNRKS